MGWAGGSCLAEKIWLLGLTGANMSVNAYKRGWPLVYRDGRWVYEDTGEPIDEERPCRRCNKMPTEDSHDACLGTIPGLVSACCGHGVQTPYFRPEPLCWHCNAVVQVVDDGWICPQCGQNGPPFDKPASNFQEGCRCNKPYIGGELDSTG